MSANYVPKTLEGKEVGRSRYSEVSKILKYFVLLFFLLQGICPKEEKENSVKKLQIIAAWPNVPER